MERQECKMLFITLIVFNDILVIMYISESNSSVEDNTSIVPSDILYQEVMYKDGERLYYANVKSTTFYIHLVTLFIQNYISLRNLHMICQCLTDKKLLQDISEQNDHCDTSSQKENHDSVSFDDSPSCQNSQKLTSLNVQTISSVYHQLENSHLGLSSKRTPARSRLAEYHVDKEEVDYIRKDLKIIRKFPQYLNLFRNHLLKLCRSEDSKMVKEELQELLYITEGLF
jgi:lysyl-tRNA synthetase class II